jgi:hypothetical protein
MNVKVINHLKIVVVASYASDALAALTQAPPYIGRKAYP